MKEHSKEILVTLILLLVLVAVLVHPIVGGDNGADIGVFAVGMGGNNGDVSYDFRIYIFIILIADG